MSAKVTDTKDTIAVQPRAKKVSRSRKNIRPANHTKTKKLSHPLLLKWLAKIIACLFALATAIIMHYTHDLPNFTMIAAKRSKPMITIRTQDGEVLANYGDLHGRLLTFNQIPKQLINAVLATEDRRFFEHCGLDIFGVARAIYRNYIAGRVVQGGSTITQQLAKILFLSPERSIKRKVQEAILAIQLEHHFSKEQIMAMYLNRVFLGRANFGVDAAARYYFGKKVEQLHLYEIAVIVGMIKAPSKYAPPNGIEMALLQGKQVLKNMADAGFISSDEIQHAVTPVFINRGPANGSLKNPYFTDYVLDQLSNTIANTHQDLNIYTTFSKVLQEKLEAAINTIISEREHSISQIAAIVMTKDGKIKAMLGGKSYVESQFNRATHAYRQSGSAFKIFVYLAALEHGYKIDQYIRDAPIKIGNWKPRNFSRNFMGLVSIQDAFAYSLNTTAVLLSEQIGRYKVIEIAKRLGITGHIPNTPSVALGTAETTLLHLTAAYATIANYGLLTIPYTITHILDSNGQVIKITTPIKKNVLNTDVVNSALALLSSSVEYGTGKAAKIPNKKIRGKTGTTQEFRDAWFIGFSEELVVGIWTGNDNNAPMKKITGGSMPARVFATFIQSISTN